MTSVFSCQNSVSLCPASFCTPGQTGLLPQVISWLPTFAFQSPMMIFFGCQFQKVLYIFIEPFRFSFFNIIGWGIDLDYCDIERFALQMNRDPSVTFEIALKYCISDSMAFQTDSTLSHFYKCRERQRDNQKGKKRKLDYFHQCVVSA